MYELPKGLKQGEPARLFPVIAETGKEQRATSILLAVVSAVPEFADELLRPLGQRITGRAKIDTFIEITFENDEGGKKRNRPDGLISISTSSKSWSCLVESKVGNSSLEQDQVERYLRLARDNGIDAVLTISNEFSAVPNHHPLKISGHLCRRVDLFHVSWYSILTTAILLHEQKKLSDKEQAFIIREFVRFFTHPSAGIAGFQSMPREWSMCVEKVQAGGGIARAEADIIVRAWHQEVRDLSLLLSRIISCDVSTKLSRAHVNSQDSREADDQKALIDKGHLIAEFSVPNTASAIQVVADLNTRSLRISMAVDAPRDKARNKTRITWMLRQLKDVSTEDVFLKPIFAGKQARSLFRLSDLRENPEAVEVGYENSDLKAFEIIIASNSARRFSGVRTFIEEIELLVPRFYEVVGQHLESWTPPPPKPRHSILASNEKSTNSPDKRDVKASESEPAAQSGNAHDDLLEIPSFLARTLQHIRG